jgi:hypothetical protein
MVVSRNILLLIDYCVKVSHGSSSSVQLGPRSSVEDLLVAFGSTGSLWSRSLVCLTTVSLPSLDPNPDWSIIKVAGVRLEGSKLRNSSPSKIQKEKGFCDL